EYVSENDRSSGYVAHEEPNQTRRRSSKTTGSGGRLFTLGCQRHSGLCGEQEEGEGLLQVQADDGVRVVEVSDGDILADVQIEVAATGREDKGSGDGRRPNDLALEKALDVAQHRVSVVAGRADA